MISEYGVPVIFLQQQTDWTVVAGTWAAAIAGIAAVIASVWIFADSKRPEIVAYITRDEDAGSVLLVVANVGGGCAYDVSLSDFDMTFVGLEGADDAKFEGHREMVRESFVFKGIPMLAPGDTRCTVVCNCGYAVANLEGRTSDISATYYTAKKHPRFMWWKRKRGSFTLDYYSFAHTLYSKSNEYRIMQALEKMAKAEH